MRYLIVSDLHSNWEALEALLAAAEGGFDRIVCCGDLVGYGADPNRVTDWVRSSEALVIRGNHDKACVGLEDLEWFNPAARDSAEWTIKELTEENENYLRGLPRGPLAINGFQIVHGSPLDEDEYIVTQSDAALTRPYLDVDLTFFGHTHVQGGFGWRQRQSRQVLRPGPAAAETVLQLEPDSVYLLNPGSAGQPRDRDPRAAYVIYSSDDRTVTYRRIPYDVESAQQKILNAGLHPFLAARLSEGR